MTRDRGAPLVAGLSIEGPDGAAVVVDPRLGARHPVPPALLPPLRRILASAAVDDPGHERWLEARHLLYSKRVARVEAWAARRMPPPGTPPSIEIAPEARFACHGCGACCRGYTEIPVSDAVRLRLLERASDLAPHVGTPPEGWFAPSPSRGSAEAPAWAFALRPSGECVFLGADSACAIHRWLGPEAKAAGCTVYPLLVTRKGPCTTVSLRPECPQLWRSLAGGPPLDARDAWVADVAARGPCIAIAGIVRVAEDLHVPYPLARLVEQRALALLQEAPEASAAHRTVRDLVLATWRSLPARPEPADLDRAETLTAAPAERLRRAAGEVRPAVAREALQGLLDSLLGLLRARAERHRALLPQALGQQEQARLVEAIVSGRLATLSPGTGPRDHAPSDEALRAEEIARARPDPTSVAFVRTCGLHHVASSRPLVSPPGLVHGFAEFTLGHLLARHGAGLVALRAGAGAPVVEHWNASMSHVDRTLRHLDTSGATKALVAAYGNLDGSFL